VTAVRAAARSAGSALATALDALLAARPPRAGSLVVTLFGDAISTQGESVWLGDLIAALELFGLNARQVRTAVFRLAQEGWLTGEQRGRRSCYRYTEFGRRQYARAAERIYAAEPPPWAGDWTLVTPVAVSGPPREELRRRLAWQGFALLGGGLLAHPCANRAALADTLDELGLTASVLVWRAEAASGPALDALVAGAWHLDEAGARYAAFLDLFRPFAALLDGGPAPAPEEAFRLRTLLVHEYRRIVLATTEMPVALLPADWPGHAARTLARKLYCRLHDLAGAWVSANMHDPQGPLGAPRAASRARFGGGRPDPASIAASARPAVDTG
jgi:phenylacetic acid degradation operon negative regulatory protein